MRWTRWTRQPAWKLQPDEPIGQDEPEVKAKFEREAVVTESWEQLQEWQRQSWRRSLRGH